jgi:hypothetical protein
MGFIAMLLFSLMISSYHLGEELSTAQSGRASKTSVFPFQGKVIRQE